MSKRISEELEFERSRMELLKQMNVDLTDKKVSNYKTSPSPSEALNTAASNGKYAWEYEIEDYRKRKNHERFCFFGACCGVLSLILTLVFNYGKIMEMFF